MEVKSKGVWTTSSTRRQRTLNMRRQYCSVWILSPVQSSHGCEGRSFACVGGGTTHETVLINTPKGASASVGGGIERANEVEQEHRSRFEENYREFVGLDHKMLPFLVRHCAWLITHFQVKSVGRTPYERLRGRPYQGQVAEFAEVVHFRDPGKAADMPKLDDRWNLCGWERGWRQTSTMWGLQQEVSIHLEAPRETTLKQEDV